MSAMTLLAMTAPNFFCNAQAADKNCRVLTRQGIYNGFVDKRGVKTWLGIPYAKPPVGKLRWHAPEKLSDGNGEFDAKNFGATPPQDIDKFETASINNQSEDCLTLNIWTRGGKNLPVMIFIPGGGFINGGTSDPLYNCAKLAARHDVLFVTINYRLNIFGSLNLAAIDPNFEGTGNLCIQDQVAALRWVKENISEFGGDPDNITVFGESAGSISTMLLTVTPAAKNLFGKAIAQSGHLGFYHTFDYSAALAEKFMHASDCKNIRELLSKSTEELKAAYMTLIEGRPFLTEVDFMPTCDGKFLPEHPLAELKNGAARGIKFMSGTTVDEYYYWALYFDNLPEIFPDFHTELALAIYEGEFETVQSVYETWQKNHPREDYLEFANQLDWRVGQELTAEYQSAFNDVYYYLFSQKSSIKNLDSCHAIDLPFVFGNPSNDVEAHPSEKLIKQVQAAWISFAKTGNPNNPLIPNWQPYGADNRQTMEINSKRWTAHKDLNNDNLAELRGVYESYLLD